LLRGLGLSLFDDWCGGGPVVFVLAVAHQLQAVARLGLAQPPRHYRSAAPPVPPSAGGQQWLRLRRRWGGPWWRRGQLNRGGRKAEVVEFDFFVGVFFGVHQALKLAA